MFGFHGRAVCQREVSLPLNAARAYSCRLRLANNNNKRGRSVEVPPRFLRHVFGRALFSKGTKSERSGPPLLPPEVTPALARVPGGGCCAQKRGNYAQGCARFGEKSVITAWVYRQFAVFGYLDAGG